MTRCVVVTSADSRPSENALRRVSRYLSERSDPPVVLGGNLIVTTGPDNCLYGW